MPTTRDQLIAASDELLNAAAFSDYCPNGLQVYGSEDITTIATAVSCTRDIFERAANAGAQMLLTHHGLFWKSTPQVIDPIMRERLRVLFDANMSLVGYHLPLDAHPTLGNNALICDALELTRRDERIGTFGGHQIGFIGDAPSPDGMPFSALIERITTITGNRTPLVLGARPETVHTLAICSGGGSGILDEAARAGCDALLTGEPHESSDAHARELGITLIAAGHHATETFGIRALGDELARQFSLEHHFLNVENPV